MRIRFVLASYVKPAAFSAGIRFTGFPLWSRMEAASKLATNRPSGFSHLAILVMALSLSPR